MQPRSEAVIAFDFGGTKIDVALASTTGELLERVRLETLADQGPGQSLRRAASAAAVLAERSSVKYGRTVVAHAAVSPGVIGDAGVRFAPNLPGWEDLAFAQRLAAELGVSQVAVSNDVHAGALAESRSGALVGADPAIYVSLGTGLAAALVVDGRVVNGAHGASGEIGYFSVDPTAPVEPGLAPLEEIVGGRALGERATATLTVPLTAAELFARTDARAKGIVEHAIAVLAGVLANLALFTDPARIALGGGIMADAATILPVVRRRLEEAVLFPPEVVLARFAQDASLHGAVALALDVALRQGPRS